VSTLRQVAARITEKTATAQQVVLPACNTDSGAYKVVYGRVGRVILQDLRIFLLKENDKLLPPFYIPKLLLRANEFTPPSAARDDSGFSALYQSLDASWDGVWKRCLAELMASKTNNAALLQTALWEIADALTNQTKA
jgi:hypothetical protein